jgi:hypothetical protein
MIINELIERSRGGGLTIDTVAHGESNAVNVQYNNIPVNHSIGISHINFSVYGVNTRHMFLITIIMDKRFITYMVGASAYGFLRKACQVSNAHVETYDGVQHKHKMVPMLLSDKITLIGFSTLIAPYLAPVFLHEDIKWAEIRLRKADPGHYGYTEKKHVFQYTF